MNIKDIWNVQRENYERMGYSGDSLDAIQAKNLNSVLKEVKRDLAERIAKVIPPRKEQRV